MRLGIHTVTLVYSGKEDHQLFRLTMQWVVVSGDRGKVFTEVASMHEAWLFLHGQFRIVILSADTAT